MIAFIEGKIISLTPTYVIMQAGGIGYQINITLHTFTILQKLSECKLFTYLHVKKGIQSIEGFDLFGFFEEEEKEMFEKLLSVSGIGANTSRMMLSTYKADEIENAIALGDVHFLKKIKGIGQKTAERAVLELRDKMGVKADNLSQPLKHSNNKTKDLALSALVMLGFNKSTADKAVSQITTQTDEVLTVEELIKRALKQL